MARRRRGTHASGKLSALAVARRHREMPLINLFSPSLRPPRRNKKGANRDAAADAALRKQRLGGREIETAD